MRWLFSIVLWTLAGLLLVAGAAQGGYAHRFIWKQQPDPEQLRACLREMQLVVAAMGKMLGDGDGEGKPRVDATEVEFNGMGRHREEPFVFPGEQGFNACETAGKPYDAVVTACLIIARDHFPADVLEIRSDGNWDEGDWDGGKHIYQSVLHRRARNPMVATDALGNRPEQTHGERLPAIVSLLISLLFFAVLVAIFLRRQEGGR
jgi:hypothetical protein